MYQYKQMGDKYVVSLRNRAEITGTLAAFCVEKKITAGTIVGLGAVSELTLRFFSPRLKKYMDKTFHEQLEISNLIGNISTLDGCTYLHMHIVAGRSDFSSVGGHLLSAVVNGAGEFVIEDLGGRIERTFYHEIGLSLYDFDK